MINERISVQILEKKKDKLAVKLPFLEIPVTMNYDFFNRRLATGYFQLNDEDSNC